MSLWKRISSTPEHEQRMKSYYDTKGLTEIRVIFAQWIEQTIMNQPISVDNLDQIQHIAHKFQDDLKQKLIPLATEQSLKLRIADICAQVTQLSAVELFTYLHIGIQREVHLLKEGMPINPYNMSTNTCDGVDINGGGVVSGGGIVDSPMMGGGGPVGSTFGSDLFAAHSALVKLNEDFVREVGPAIHTFQADNSTFQRYLEEYNRTKTLISPQDLQEGNLQMQNRFTVMFARKNELTARLRHIIRDYNLIQEAVINELKKWQRNQALAGNGAQFHDNLIENIQSCIEMLVDIVGTILKFVSAMISVEMDENTELREMMCQVRYAQQVLVLSAFIVEKQPPQVMKTNTRFAAAVRWLIGPKLGVNMRAPSVECIILSETQAQRHFAQRTMGDATTSPAPPSSGEILNNVATMEYNAQTHVFTASFRNMQLKKIKRAEKKGTESVMDEKFALLFYTSSVVDDYSIRVWTLSLPVVVIVHGNQEPQSWATITWDNAFSDISREPFQVPDRVSWSQLALALNMKFGSSTGRQLTDENLNFLYEKLFRNEQTGDHKEYITWAQFCKEPLPERSFTFWDWFYAIMKVTKDHLLGLWKAGLIVGFVSKTRVTDEILPRQRIGTFLLRFSDSELGGITVALVDETGQPLMLSPWTSRDLNIRNLADRVNDLAKHCHFVYPLDKPRDEAFGEFYTSRMDEQRTRDGYVVNTIRAHVPAIEHGSSPPSHAPTPQHYMQSPNPQIVQMSNAPMLNDLDYDYMV